MSKCDVQIEFDRRGRVYRGGESISGHVRIAVNQDVSSRGIRLTHTWRTHGRGNADTGKPTVITLADAGLLTAGENIELPFQLDAPTWPVTYRGHLLNVDHYLRVDVDVAWARNPSATEEFVLLAGSPPPEFTGDRSTVVALKQKTPQRVGLVGRIIFGAIGIALLGLIAVFAMFLLPVIVVVVLFFWIRHKAVAARVGQVTLEVPHRIVAPGEEWTATLQFTPRRTFMLNTITMKLDATETVVSGSGTDRTTHRHSQFTQIHTLREAGQVTAGSAVSETIRLTFPQTRAYSFEASDNSLRWTAEFRIDIPRYPDWAKTEPLQIVPAEYLGLEATDDGNTPGLLADEVDDDLDFDDDDDEAEAETADVPAESTRRGPAVSGSARPRSESRSIMDLVAAISTLGPHSPHRADVIRDAAGNVYAVSIAVDRVSFASGLMAADPQYAAGKSVIGTIDGTRQAILVQTTQDAAPRLQNLKPGDAWQASIRVVDWDSLYNRITAQEA